MFGRLRSAPEILLCMCVACAAEPVSKQRGGFTVDERDYVGAMTAPSTAAPAAPAGESSSGPRLSTTTTVVDASAALDPAAMERLLREEFAAPGDPTEPALDLAGFLCSRERFDEALAVVDLARERAADPRLRIARAGLLRDLGRRPAAAGELRALVRERGAAELHPSLLLEWAELEWQNGDFAAAREAMADLSRAHGGDPWCVEHRQWIDELAAAVARERVGRRGERDLLGDLRGGEAVAVRLAALDGLATLARLQPADGDTEGLDQAIAIAFHDVAEEVRRRAVELAPSGSAVGPVLIAAALADDAAAVRAAAARRAFELDRDGAAAALLDRLAAEADPFVFVALHRGLAAAIDGAPALPADGGSTSESRAALVAAWRERCDP